MHCQMQRHANSGQEYLVTDEQIFLSVNDSQGAPGLDIVNKFVHMMVMSGKEYIGMCLKQLKIQAKVCATPN